jgi:predicted dehydrogenase
MVDAQKQSGKNPLWPNHRHHQSSTVGRPALAICLWVTAILAPAPHLRAQETDSAATDSIRIGIIGLDTSHVLAFTREFQRQPPSDPAIAGFRVVAAYPHGSSDIESSASRIPQYTSDIAELGVQVVDSIADLLSQVDCVLLETNDGRLHLEQAIEVFRAGKPVFIDKPAGSNLAEVVAIYRASDHYGVPMFSSSSLRFSQGAQAIRAGKFGRVLGCDAYSPCALEKTHVDLFWYGIHGVESLFTCMGKGCETVSHTSTDDFELAVGVWSDGRIGTFRGIRAGKSGYGGTAFGEKGIGQIEKFSGYQPLVVEIAKFFHSREVPIDPQETVNLYAFMQAAADSKASGGMPVTIAAVMAKAEQDAAALLEGKLDSR